MTFLNDISGAVVPLVLALAVFFWKAHRWRHPARGFLERVSHTRCRGCFRRASHCIRPPATRGLRQLTRGAGRCYACLDRGRLDCRAADSQSRAGTLSAGCFGIIGLDHYAYSLAATCGQIETLPLSLSIRRSQALCLSCPLGSPLWAHLDR